MIKLLCSKLFIDNFELPCCFPTKSHFNDDSTTLHEAPVCATAMIVLHSAGALPSCVDLPPFSAGVSHPCDALAFLCMSPPSGEALPETATRLQDASSSGRSAV